MLKLEDSGVQAEDGQDLLLLCNKENVPEKLRESMRVLLEHPTCSHPPLGSIDSVQESELCELCIKRKKYGHMGTA